MGWKGTIRSINAAANRADRNAKKRQRDLQNRHKQHEKMQELEQAAYEVEVFENHIEVIQSVHKECSDRVDWNKVAVMPAPEKPGFSDKLELAAISKKDNYVPGFIDRIFKRIERKLKDFDAAIEIARSEDRKNHEIAINQWEQDHNDWADNVEQSNLLLSGDPEAKIKTIKELNPFSELNTLGSSLHFVVTENSLLIVTINIHGEEIIPSEQKSLLKSGKLSVKKMPIGKFNEIYQDYVCSSVLRVANEIFSILPDEYVLINAKDKLLNSASGHLEDQIILSVYIPKSTLTELKMDSIDPSDSMANFIHNMLFKKTKGFEPVDPVSAPGLQYN